MNDRRPMLDLTDHQTRLANARGSLPPAQREAIVQFLSTMLQSSIAGASSFDQRAWGFRYPYQVKSALDHGQVASVDGTIGPNGRFQPTGPTASSLALRFPTWSGQPGDLPTGRYRFYYLPEVNFVLSAQPLTPTGEPRDPAIDPAPAAPDPALFPLAHALACALGFDQAELAENRAGHLSERQRQVAQAQVGPQRLQRLAWGGFLCLFGPLLIWLALTGATTGGSPAWLVAFGVIFGAVGVLVFRSSNSYGAVVRAGHVVAMEGIGRRFWTRDRNPSYYGLHIGVWRFYVSKAVYDAFVDGRPYRAYYLPGTSQLLSIEPLSHSAPVAQDMRKPDLHVALS